MPEGPGPNVSRPLLEGYQPLPGCWDEYLGDDGRARPALQGLAAALDRAGQPALVQAQRMADNAFLQAGVTFTVYADQQGTERIFPFDLIPRVVTGPEWRTIERGLTQRVEALNRFIEDVYGARRIVAEGVIPEELILASPGYLKQVDGIRPRGGVFTHVSGIDLVRAPDGAFLVLEDNVRTPSGVSYVLENRLMLKRVLPDVFAASHVRSVEGYPNLLRSALLSLSPVAEEDSNLVVLTPGRFNSAYFEHSFLARRMGVPLVEARDLFVHQQRVYVKTTQGPQRVHVVYRRVDDEFLDPEVFREDSMLGVPGIMGAYAAGNVTLANAVGNGVADDKATYPFVPDIIRFYLGEEPLLGQIETLICAREDERKRVLGALENMVVKAVDASGGYGMLFGPVSTAAEREAFAARIQAQPRKYVAQPVCELSACPTWIDGRLVPRRVDLRPYVVAGREIQVLPGGLTRVALVDGSYVVNSSQGGGSKDTWVLEDEDQQTKEGSR